MTPDTTGDLGSLLGVWAHPDDEAYLSAGLMMHAVDEGRRVVCVTATKGEAGFPDDDSRSAAERSRIRETELAACLEVLGVTEHRWLGYADGGCAGVDDEEAAQHPDVPTDDHAPSAVRPRWRGRLTSPQDIHRLRSAAVSTDRALVLGGGGLAGIEAPRVQWRPPHPGRFSRVPELGHGAGPAVQAAVSYSLRSPPRIGRRQILPWTGSGTGDVGRGGCNRSARCGRHAL